MNRFNLANTGKVAKGACHATCIDRLSRRHPACSAHGCLANVALRRFRFALYMTGPPIARQAHGLREIGCLRGGSSRPPRQRPFGGGLAPSHFALQAANLPLEHSSCRIFGPRIEPI